MDVPEGGSRKPWRRLIFGKACRDILKCSGLRGEEKCIIMEAASADSGIPCPLTLNYDYVNRSRR